MITELLPGAKRGQEKEPGEGAASETHKQNYKCVSTHREETITLILSTVHATAIRNRMHIFFLHERHARNRPFLSNKYQSKITGLLINMQKML